MMNKITRPTFAIIEKKAKANIGFMARKFSSRNIRFRPHFKTHQSEEIGEWFRGEGISQISVSSVDMALQFARVGWKDILIAFPFNRLQLDDVNTISRNNTIGIVLEDAGTARYVSKNTSAPLQVYIKVDCGYGRTGVPSYKSEDIAKLAKLIRDLPNLELKALMAHFGNTYHAKGTSEVEEIYRSGVHQLNILREFLHPEIPALEISVGDTPSASLVEDLGRIDEMRPGNFVFYDWMQYEIGSCETEQIAALMLCPVVAKHPERNEMVIHGGAVHFSKEKGREHYGPVCRFEKGELQIVEDSFLKSLSQEHGIVKASKELMESTAVGDVIGIIPIHSCLTANLMKAQGFMILGSAENSPIPKTPA